MNKNLDTEFEVDGITYSRPQLDQNPTFGEAPVCGGKDSSDHSMCLKPVKAGRWTALPRHLDSVPSNEYERILAGLI